MPNTKSAKQTKPATKTATRKKQTTKKKETKKIAGNGDVAPPAPLKTKWTNQEIATLFYRIADILELQGETVFKVIAYRRAADSIEHLGRNVQDIWAGDAENLRAISGVGEAIAQKVDELFRTGHMSYYEKISKDIPPGRLQAEISVTLIIPGMTSLMANVE